MIAVIGDILLDIFLLPELRAAEQGGGVVLRGGGSAANTAAWLSYLGTPASFTGCVGADPVGEMLDAELRSHGVRTNIRRVQGRESGAVAVDVGIDGERSMRSSRGANWELSPDDILALDFTPAWIHLTAYALLGTYELDFLLRIGEFARRHGARLSFDPSSETAIAHFGREEVKGTMQRAGVHLLLANRWETEALTGLQSVEESLFLLTEIVPECIMKDGPDGALFVSNGGVARVATQPLQPLDTTGAGDAFNAGALHALAQGQSMAQACKTGNETAGRVLLQYGGRPPSRA